MTEGSKLMSGDISIYIHIPFCKKKCNYCDFLSFLLPCKNGVADYVIGLKKELELVAPKVDNLETVSLYIGGGTPSLISFQHFQDIVSTVKEQMLLSPDMEFTIEANPGTLSRQKLVELVSLGVNRLSLGVQSMDDRLLSAMGRLHTAKDAQEAFFLAREVGFGNISIDLMHGLPGQSLDDWRNTLQAVIEMNPEHVSVYGLNIEPGTPWGDLYQRGQLPLPGEEECVRMYRMAREMLFGAGFVQYEISNYAQPGYECRHNLRYWYRRPYLGVGAGAASFIGGVRYKNHSDLRTYLNILEHGRLPVAEEEKISREQAIAETMFLELRTAKGVNETEFARLFGTTVDAVYSSVLEPLEEAGVIIREGPYLRLAPEYYEVSNEVFLKFI